MREAAMAAERPFSMARVERLAAVGVAAGGILAWAVGGIAAALSLTGSGAVAIINLRWLDVVVERAIQPGGPRIDARAALRYGLRLVLLGAVLAAVRWMPRVEPVAVAAGFSIPLVFLVGEGLLATE